MGGTGLGNEITVQVHLSGTEYLKRGCEFRGLRILENTGRGWLRLAPE